MANITPRINKNGEITSYTIRVYHGYDSKGKRLKLYTMSYKPCSGNDRKADRKGSSASGSFVRGAVPQRSGRSEQEHQTR